MGRYAIILAAGKGSRMKSLNAEVSKVSYEILGKPLVRYVLDALSPLELDQIVTVVGYGGEVTTKIVEDISLTVWQKELKGTGRAVMQAEELLKSKSGTTFVVTGDTPLITSKTLKEFFYFHETQRNDVTVLTAIPSNPHGYGRIIKDENGNFVAIIEQADLVPGQEKIQEVNTGFLIFNNQRLFEQLEHLKPANKQGEYYLTDLIALFKKNGYQVGTYQIESFEETLGINDRVQLEEASQTLRKRINRQHMLQGVTLLDSQNTYLGPDVEIGPDCIIYPGTMILGRSIIGHSNVIGPETYILNSQVGTNNHIVKSYIIDSKIYDNNEVGPFTHLRGGALLEGHNRVGNFVEVKKSILHEGAKAAHLSYLGDAEIGKHSNIGCGTIIANYDGKNKWFTTIGENVFVGSGTTIISPVKIENNAFIAAGSTINKDVAEDDLAIGRARQENKAGYAKILKEKIKNKSSK